MSTIPPSARTWTLRFKHQRTTVLVHVDPLQRWPLVRADLLRALRQTHPTGSLPDSNDGAAAASSFPIPQDADDVLLALLVDPNDPTQGWVALDADTAFASADEVGKGKGKAGAPTAKARNAREAVKDCPQGAGLRDGGVLAFKFRKGGGGVEGEDGDWVEVRAEELGVDGAREEWDVVMPSYEDTYDEQEEEVGDEGLGMDE